MTGANGRATHGRLRAILEFSGLTAPSAFLGGLASGLANAHGGFTGERIRRELNGIHGVVVLATG